jgi:hypothetical protein
MSLADTRDPHSLSSKLRKKRDLKLRRLIETIHDGQGAVSIVDIGGTLGYWERVGLEFLSAHNVKVTLINLHASELSDVSKSADIFTNLVGNGCDLNMIADGAFDLAHSNSVIEHVHGWANMKAFAQEFRRVSKSFYIQTPYFWFPFDPHFYKMPFFHWLPRPIRRRLLMRFSLAYSGRVDSLDKARSIIDGAVLLDGGEMRFLFPEANIEYEKFYGLRKSLIAVKN